jgi:putative aldouronate transport system substrate-binding protein
MGNQFIQWVGENEDPDKYTKLKEFSDTGFPHVSLGFRFDREPVDNEITAVANVRASMARSLRTGAVDPEIELPKMIEQMKAAGSEKIGDEIRSQFEDFLSNK